MNDRELLEFAAKAAGYEFTHYSKEMGLWASVYPSGRFAYWSPLTDDGDALRLAVKLNIGIPPHTDWLSEPNCCHYEYTRRAIVRAAAEIGRAMP